MDQIIEFASNHYILVGSFVAVLLALIIHLIADPGGKFGVDPAGATTLINHQDAVVVDVRSMAEFKRGHIVNALNIPLNGLGNSLKQLEKHRKKPILAVCQSGSRSVSACRRLRKHGFENVKNLRGGMMAWESANLPVKRT